jgi:glycosyltransferase involved in cell wall biosynthesis
MERAIFLSVVMPAYNESDSLEAVLLDHFRALEKLSDQISMWEVVCVDDGSADRTPEILRDLSRHERRLRVVRHGTNQGIFAAFTRGYQEARGTHIYSTASDGQWPTENLEVMLARLRAGSDLVVGVRENRRAVYTISRRLVSYAFNTLPRIFFGVVTQDAGSVKLGVQDVFRFDLISRSPFSEAERLIRAVRAGYNVAFVPIRFNPRTGGTARGASWRNVRHSIYDMFRCAALYGPR